MNDYDDQLSTYNPGPTQNANHTRFHLNFSNEMKCRGQFENVHASCQGPWGDADLCLSCNRDIVRFQIISRRMAVSDIVQTLRVWRRVRIEPEEPASGGFVGFSKRASAQLRQRPTLSPCRHSNHVSSIFRLHTTRMVQEYYGLSS